MSTSNKTAKQIMLAAEAETDSAMAAIRSDTLDRRKWAYIRSEILAAWSAKKELEEGPEAVPWTKIADDRPPEELPAFRKSHSGESIIINTIFLFFAVGVCAIIVCALFVVTNGELAMTLGIAAAVAGITGTGFWLAMTRPAQTFAPSPFSTGNVASPVRARQVAAYFGRPEGTPVRQHDGASYTMYAVWMEDGIDPTHEPSF